jgi:uncharacterized protein YifN (PemK superfamily)
MNSLEVMSKFSEELDFDQVEMVSEFLDAKGLATELEGWLKQEHAKQLARGRCAYCRTPGGARNKLHVIPNTDIKYCNDCRAEAAEDAEIQLKW